jgi:hypothetical protein
VNGDDEGYLLPLCPGHPEQRPGITVAGQQVYHVRPDSTDVSPYPPRQERVEQAEECPGTGLFLWKNTDLDKIYVK